MSSNLANVVRILVVIAVSIAVGWGAGGQAMTVGGISALLLCCVAAMAIQWLAFVPAALAKTERFYDLTGGLTYLTVVGLALTIAWQQELLTARRAVLSAFVVVWAVRLSSFLFRRIHRAGKDGRFDTIKRNPLAFLLAWSLQGLWVFLTALPVFILLTNRAEGPPIGLWDGVGWTLWVLGFGIEVIADQQKSAFNAQPENRGRWVDSGLWAYSQHPNYFGEIVLWTGLCMSGFGVYVGTQWLALITPVFVIWLLTRVSGIPLLDARAEAKWGENEDYKAYRRSTPVLLLWFPKGH